MHIKFIGKGFRRNAPIKCYVSKTCNNYIIIIKFPAFKNRLKVKCDFLLLFFHIKFTLKFSIINIIYSTDWDYNAIWLIGSLTCSTLLIYRDVWDLMKTDHMRVTWCREYLSIMDFLRGQYVIYGPVRIILTENERSLRSI